MDNLIELTRDEMRNIKAGIMCRTFLRDANGNAMGYSTCTNYYEASSAMGETNPDGSYVSGYCCASCGSGDFENAEPC